MIRAYLLLVFNIHFIMQISELTIPPNSKRVTYEISEEGKLVLLKN